MKKSRKKKEKKEERGNERKKEKKARRIRWFGIDRLAKQGGTWENDIKEIGYKTGFNDPTNFVKFFKKYTKTTPASFRKQFQ